MRTASTKLTDEEYKALNNWCQANNRTINEVLGSVVRDILQGKVKPKPTGLESRQDLCPRCGHVVHILETPGNKLYFWCPRCDWVGFLGVFTWPDNIEDWSKKFKEV